MALASRDIVFTDLDGTLLDNGYSYEPAIPALQALTARQVPLILVSSKTRPEIERLRATLQHTHPFIVENGGAVFIPRGTLDCPNERTIVHDDYVCVEFGARYSVLREALKDISATLGVQVKGMGDMTVAEIGALTGLPPAEAHLARQREYDEPFLVLDGSAALQALQREARRRGLDCTSGGRFFHLLGGTDKGRACQYLIECYRHAALTEPRSLRTIGLGNSLNDLPMLAVVDVPVLVRNSDNAYDVRVDLPNLIRAEGIGPVGWNAAILSLIPSA